jgi:hypothetical protein
MMPALAYPFSLLSGTGSVNVRLNRISSGQSIFVFFEETPLLSMRRVQSISSAAPTSTFLGSHPRRAQVPPKGLESTMATFHPAFRHLCRSGTSRAGSDHDEVKLFSICIRLFFISVVMFTAHSNHALVRV